VVTAKRDDARQCLALDCRAPLIRICRRWARKNSEMTFFNLLESERVVVSSSFLVCDSHCERRSGLRGNRDVTAVEHSGPTVEGVGLQRNIVSSTDLVVRITRDAW
jgi:hypothetical protein